MTRRYGTNRPAMIVASGWPPAPCHFRPFMAQAADCARLAWTDEHHPFDRLTEARHPRHHVNHRRRSRGRAHGLGATGGQELYSFYVFNGHGTADGLMLIPFIPGLICAALALCLGTVSLRRRNGGRTCAIVGLVAGAIAVAFMVSGTPVALVPDPRIPQGPL